MKNKKIFFLLSVLTLSALSMNKAKAEEVTFSGVITASSCDLNIPIQNIDLGSVSVGTLKPNTDGPAGKTFTITITGCDASQKNIAIKFGALSDAASDKNYFKNNDDAKNVALFIKRNDTNALIKPGDSPSFTLNPTLTTLSFTPSYRGLSGTPTAGDFEAEINIDFTTN